MVIKMGIIEELAKPVLGDMTGLPAMPVPLHMPSQGLPIGMQFVGRMCDEASLLGLAGQLEREGLLIEFVFKNNN